MTKLNLLLLGLIASWQLTACGNPAVNEKKDNVMKETAIKWEVIAKGTQCAIQQPLQAVVKTQAEFDSLWKTAFSGVDVPVEKPVVDFSGKWVIAAFKGLVSTGGHDVDIASIEATADGLKVRVKEVKPAQGCMVTQALEYPFIMVSVDKPEKTAVQFTVETVEKKCD